MSTKAQQIRADDATQDAELPEGWAELKLGEVGELVTGTTPVRNVPANFGTDYPWVKPPDLDNDCPITHTGEGLSKKGAASSRLLAPGSVMVSCIGNLGKVGFAGTYLATNQQINSVTFTSGLVHPNYGYYYCRTLKDWLEENASATTIPIVNKGRFSEAPFLLAPLPEQERIATSIAALFQQLSCTRNRLSKVPTVVKRFRQAVLAVACSGKLTEEWRRNNSDLEIAADRLTKHRKESRDDERAGIPENLRDDLPDIDSTWTWASLDQIKANEPNAITDGPFGSNLKTEHYTDKGPRVIRLQNIASGTFIDERAYISETHFKTLGKHRIFGGDLAIAVLGDPVPRVCVIPETVGPAIVKADCIRFKPDPNLALVQYVGYCLNDDATHRRMSEVVHGVGRPRLNLREVRGIPIPLPPLEEQHEIVRRVEKVFKLADAIEKRVAAATVRSEKLTQAILAKAFRGELVPAEAELARREGRTYEPASVLLERIKAERTETEEQKAPRRGKKARAVVGSNG